MVLSHQLLHSFVGYINILLFHYQMTHSHRLCVHVLFSTYSYRHSKDIEEFPQNLKVGQIIYVTPPLTKFRIFP